MTFPACKHRKAQPQPQAMAGLRWLAAEPFRVFFFSGAVWSIIGVALWPLFYWGWLGFYPNYCHSRLMIEAFGGAFVVGFLGTAGPRMASAPKLLPWELLWLFALHQAGAICHLQLRHAWGDSLFALLLLSLLSSLVIRVIRFRQHPPPQMLLALTGLLCGAVGALLWLMPATFADLHRFRLAGLLLYQGLLLPPVLGIGSFIFPRMLGGDFGEPKTSRQSFMAAVRAIGAALLVVGSFFIEAYGQPLAGQLIRAVTATAYLLVEVRWRRLPAAAPHGSLAAGMRAALITGFLGLALAGFFSTARIALEHLLYIGGFGLLILIVASRVLFGHSGDLAGFERKSWLARWLIILGLLAAATRMIPGFLPQLAFSHYQYAALTWAILALLWLGWHRKRFITREPE